jgi:hypothetical protein
VATEVITTDEFLAWYLALTEGEMEAVAHMVGLVEMAGVTLGSPYSSQIKGSEHALRELRKKGQPIRIIYAFDPKRQAVMIIGGDKTGDDRFYEVMVPQADKLFGRYLAEQAAGLHDKEEEK